MARIFGWLDTRTWDELSSSPVGFTITVLYNRDFSPSPCAVHNTFCCSLGGASNHLSVQISFLARSNGSMN